MIGQFDVVIIVMGFSSLHVSFTGRVGPAFPQCLRVDDRSA